MTEQNGSSQLTNHTFDLKIITIITLMAVLYFASSLVLPFIISAFLALFSSPLVKFLSRLKVPRSISAALVMISLSLTVTIGFSLLLSPASNWADRLPLLSEQLIAGVDQASTSINDFKESITPSGESTQTQSETDGESKKPIDSAVQSATMSLLSAMAETTAMLAMQIASILVITYFFLVFGNDLMRSIVKAQNSFTEKKETIILFETIRDDVSRYVLTISVINISLGLAVALAMQLLGVRDPLLWGALAGLLNYAPYIGTLAMASILALVGFAEFDSTLKILLVPGCYIFLNFIEAQYITPTILGKRFNINPLLLVLWMFFWGWMWGAAGILLSIPMLVCCKIIATQTSFVTGSWLKLLNSE